MSEVLAVPSSEQWEVPQRRGKALLGWVNEPELRPLFHCSAVTSPTKIDEFLDESRTRRLARGRIPIGSPSTLAVGAVPAQLEAKAKELRSTEQFTTTYEPFGASVAMIELAELVTPQWWVDIDYVDNLAGSAPAESELDALFDFSFAVGQLARPMQLGLNGAAFASARTDIGGPGPLRVARYSPEKVIFEFDVTPRPNWVWVAITQDMNRPLILNGVHHLLALLKAGHKHALCLVRPASGLGDLLATGWNPNDLSLFKPNVLTADRPPLLRDYLDDGHAADVAIHLRQAYLRVAVQAEPGIIPRVE